MNWFKKLSKERPASPSSHCEDCNHRKCCCTHQNTPGPSNGDILAPLSDNPMELVDPEDFFTDPDHVRQYKEEEQFLKLMSEWEIVEHPNRHANFFSGDFEEELIHSKTQSLTIEENTEWREKESDPEILHDQLSMTVGCERRRRCRFSEMFFGERIETGILPPQVNNDCKVSWRRLKTDPKEASGSSTQKFKTERRLFKSEALSQSIMGAIGCCPDVEKKNESNDDPCDQSQCDHYDIQQFFRLDDNGNILLNINHIKESKGCEMKRNKKKKFCTKGKCVDESYACRIRGLATLRRILRFLWNILTGHPRNKSNPIGGPGDSVRCYTLQLAGDHTSTFAQNIENFISCTKESREAAPQVVMRNMRQFMNGMKNYLVKHGEGKFHQEVESARARLKSDEFLNLDAILETVMHQLVVLPLREHLYGMFVDHYTRTEDIQLLAQNVKYACGRNAADFGIRPAVAPPTSSALNQISNLLLRLQEAELPLEKLDLFLCIISSIFDATGCPRGQQLGADDFLPILVFVVAKCGFVGAEIEAEFMWGLLQPALLNGEAGYYLTALCSAVHVLKSFMASDNEGTGSLDWRSSSLPSSSSVIRVIIPDECNGSLQTRTLPVRPHTTTREVCRIIAHKARITNPQDYALFKLVDGEETLLTDVECPQDIRLAAKGKHCMLAYKRIDAKIAWPTAAQPSYT